jgi:asparagine synthase (glutamine-hydrolysing)
MFAIVIDTESASAGRNIRAISDALRGGVKPAATWSDGTVAVAAGVSGILAEDVFDRQPIVESDLIFASQARIDNRDEILHSLGVERAQWPQIADSDVVFRAYRRWGEDCVQQLTGDYAFAAHHRDSGRTVAAVDHVGLVRLHYAEYGGLLVISTQLNALLACRDVPRELNFAALGALIAPKVLKEQTPFAQVRVLLGGHLLHRQAGGQAARRKWWQPDATIRTFYRDPRDYVRQANELFERAVAAELRATGGIAATLSGGLDSTLVAAVAAKQLKAQGRTIAVYTAIPEPGLACETGRKFEANDWPYAAAVAGLHDNMVHASVTPGGRCSLDVLDGLYAQSRTVARNTANCIWVDEIAHRSAQAGARVLLIGGRGNATTSYDCNDVLADLFRRGRWLTALCHVHHRLARADRSRLRTIAADLIPGARALVSRLRRLTGRPERAGAICLTAAFRAQHAQALAVPSADPSSRDVMVRFMTAPVKTWGPDPLPQWSVEFRDPTADRRLIECLLSFPPEAFAIAGRSRGLARAMGEGIVPDIVRLRTTRGAQMPELAAIIAAHAATYRAVLDRAARCEPIRAIIELGEVRAALDRIVAGSAASHEPYMVDRAAAVALFILGETV